MDYTRNEDKLLTDNSTGARYNHIYQVDNISNESGEVSEPVTLAEMKDYLRLEGFQADDDSPGDEFDFDDELILDMVTEARTWVEKFTGVHLVPKTLQVVLLNQAGMIELPGPVTGTIVIKNEDDTTIDSATYKYIGSDFPKLKTPFDGLITLQYDAGYTPETCPKGLKNAIKAYVAYAYTHRGEEMDDKALTESAARKARPYRRAALWG